MLWIDHIGIVVRDLEESIVFYTMLLESPPVDRVRWRGDDAAYIAEMLNKPVGSFRADAAFFRFPYTNTLLEMLHYGGFSQDTAATVPTTIGATHIGLYVESLDETISRLGLPLTGSPVDIPYGPYRGGRSAYVSDPNGISIQLMQIQARPGQLPVLRSGKPGP